MQHAETERDLLEGAAGHEADDSALRQPVAEAREWQSPVVVAVESRRPLSETIAA